MPVEMKFQRDGRLRETWYGRYEINGRKLYVNLDVKIAGSPPPSLSLKDQGDTAFEVSRAKAMEKLNGIVEEARSQRSSERLVEKLYELKTGEAIRSVKLAELPDEWAKIPRKRKPDARYASQCQSRLKQFVAFVLKENSKAREIAQVTRTVARAFLAAEEKRRCTAKTWNDTLVLLRATFQHLLPAGGINPFSGIPTKETETVFRKPFSPEELKAILDVANDDEFIRPILITGMCSAMRRGDCCLLRGPNVDLERRFITVKTAKAGQMVSIPIFPLLLEELQKRSANIRKGGYVFPEQAAMYLKNPDGITWRVKKVLAVALGGLGGPDGRPLSAIPEVSTAEARALGQAYINELPDSEKKTRMGMVFNHYMDGKKLCEAADAAGVSKGSVSGYLNAIEMGAKCRIVRGRTEGVSITARLKNDDGLLQAARAEGGRNASVRDFHSLRVTWVTLALTAGVPLELVQKVTGHKTTDVVLKHYFQPGREDFRKALQSAMPKLLTGPTANGKSPAIQIGDSASEVQAILKRMTGRTLKKDKARLLELVAKL
jgi:integrase